MTVAVPPGQLSLKAIPPGINLWAVSNTLTMKCSGLVGSLQASGQVYGGLFHLGGE